MGFMVPSSLICQFLAFLTCPPGPIKDLDLTLLSGNAQRKLTQFGLFKAENRFFLPSAHLPSTWARKRP